MLRTFGFCARQVRQGAYGVCASRRGLVFQNCTHPLGQTLVVTMVVPPRLPVPRQPTGPPKAAAGVRGAPVHGRGQSSQGSSPRRTLESRSPGSLPRRKRLAGPASLSAPGCCRGASKVGAGMWLEASPAVAGAWARVSTEATAQHPPPRHGAAATRGGHRPQHHQCGPLPCCVMSCARMSIPL